MIWFALVAGFVMPFRQNWISLHQNQVSASFSENGGMLTEAAWICVGIAVSAAGLSAMLFVKRSGLPVLRRGY